MTTLFVLLHYDHVDAEDDAPEKVIGAYSTEANAQAAIDRLRDKPGFKDFPERWLVAEYRLDVDSDWTDGFMVVRPGDRPWEDGSDA